MSEPEVDGPLSTVSSVIVARNIVKRFHHGIWPVRRTIAVLDGADLTVDRGELVGLVGENGSGKSTLMKIVVGMLDRDGGSVRRAGRLGYCPQQALLWEKLTAAEHFTLFGHAYGMDEQAARAAAADLAAELEFERYVGYRVEELSGGTRQKLNLALALMHGPDLLLLDEPYAGFDWETYLRFWDMAERRRADGMGILIVSHLLAERERLTRVVTLRDGRTSAEEVDSGGRGAALHP
jgi:ABC-type multidrug transport system ATPase subunit